MLAIRKLARGIANVSVEEVPVPVAGPEEIVAEVDSAGICGTDLHVPSAWPYALKFMAEEKINVRRLITHRFSLQAWDQALQAAQEKQGVKILLKPGGGR